MKTGDRKTFALNLPELDIEQDVNFIFIAGVGWVADRNVKMGINYNDIEKHGLVTGKEVRFDFGDYVEAYTCRILRCTEWDDCMDYSDKDDVWHWDEAYSWVRSLEYERAKCSNRVIRGYRAVASLSNVSTSVVDCGFRPVFEVLAADALKSGAPYDAENIDPISELFTDTERQLLGALICLIRDSAATIANKLGYTADILD